MEYEPEPVDLYDIVEDNIALFLSRAQQKEITLTNTIPEQTMVYADLNMVDTVIRNLVSNALKFTEVSDSIHISMNSHSTSMLEIAVADTGIGISTEGQAKLFRIDSQYTNPGTAGEKGTGLGLMLCQDLVKRNGGTIWVESEVGQGTTFRFTLPKHFPNNET